MSEVEAKAYCPNGHREYLRLRGSDPVSMIPVDCPKCGAPRRIDPLPPVAGEKGT